MATIKDVALKAGVSTATVSHVVNESRTVGPETKKKVRAAIKALNYRPDAIARSLRVARTGTFAVLVSDITNPFFAEFVRGIEDVAHERGDRNNLLLCNTEESAARERRALDVVLERRIDGLVIAPTRGNQKLLAELAAGGLPLVFGDRRLDGVSADMVLVDNAAAGARLAHHLADLGHRSVAILRADLDASAIQDRVAGFCDGLARRGLTVNPARIVDSASSIEAAEQVASRLLSAATLPDAVFCTNNFMTLGLMQALRGRGLRCPEDIAVVGFDDFPWAAAFQPRLTVIAQPAYEIGRESAKLLLERIAGQRTGPKVQIVLEAELVIRESAGELSRGLSSPA